MVTYIIIGLNVIFSVMGFQDRNLFAKYLFNPYIIEHDKKEWYRMFTHAFLHADYMHLAFNMFSFYSLGLPLEQELFPAIFHNKAEFYYILLYVGGIMASVIPSYEKHKNNPGYSSVGASGAVCAVVFSLILIVPTITLNVFFVPMPAAVYGLVFLVGSWYMSKRGGGRIAHDAHFWGSVFGLVFTVILKFSLLHDFIRQIANMF
jgi:membrane associated rhomboid family serine protease